MGRRKNLFNRHRKWRVPTWDWLFEKFKEQLNYGIDIL
jgi:hypothetical protein